MATANALKKDTGPDNWNAFQAELLEVRNRADADEVGAWLVQSIAERDKWPAHWRELAKEEINKRREVLINGMPDDDVFPGDRPSTKGNAYADNFQAG
jgi:hypothetical protein